jgi:glycerol uptake facilitator-like aquaporin
MIGKFLAEVLGTFVFLAVIIISGHAQTKCEDAWTWLKIGLALSISILLVGAISGAHLNPAVSYMLYLNNDIPIETLLLYIIAQLIGGTLAFFYYGVVKSYKTV